MTIVNTSTGEIVETNAVINYRIHPAADIFPLIDGEEFDQLVADIRERGQIEPVVLDADGVLIDGRNRARACAALGIDVKEIVYDGDDVVGHIVSLNLRRRQLTDTQRAMVAARLANLPVGANQHRRSEEGPSSGGPSRSEVRRLLNVSEGSLHRAKVVDRQGSPDLKALTTEGKVPLASAVRMAGADDETQAEFVEEVRAGADPAEASVRLGGEAKVRRPSQATAVTRDMRADAIRDLAEQGYSSRQMPEKVGVSEESVRKIARDFGIEIPADRSIRGTRRVDSGRIVANTVTALEGLVMGIDLVDFDDLDPQEAGQWADSLSHSLRALNRFVKQIKESTHDH